MKELKKELQDALKDILKRCEEEDQEVRKEKIRDWKEAEEFWHGVQFLFWSDRDQTWVSPLDLTWRANLTDEQLEEIGPFYDFVIDIYKAHGDAIISALAAKIPGVRFIPDDPDNSEDVITAKTYSKISDLIYRHNKAKLLFLKSLFYLYIQGTVASYRYVDSDVKYGSYKVPQYETEEIEIPEHLECSVCAAQREPQDSICPTCGTSQPPIEVDNSKQEVPKQVGEKLLPKSRVLIRIYGPLFYKIPFYSTTMEEVDYCILYRDLAKSTVLASVKDKVSKEKLSLIRGESIDNWDRFPRAAATYPNQDEYTSKYLVTTRTVWMRPEAFYRHEKDDVIESLLKEFPDGVRFEVVGKQKIFVEYKEESIDDRWQFGKAGISTYLSDSDAIGRSLIPIQKMRNQLVNLVMDHIEHGIPATFAEAGLLDFDAYGKFEPLPGYMYRIKKQTNKALAESFYTEQKPSLPREVPYFQQSLDKDAQFSVGSFPSIYGGPSEGKSRTFAEYAASRQMALQRLSIVWSFILDWWCETIFGAVKLYVTTVVDDQYYTKWNEGGYIKVWVKRSELDGVVGGVEPEGSEDFPVSLTQKNSTIMKLVEMQNPAINQVLFAPENIRMLQDALSLGEIKVPGEMQRIKQIIEINDLMKGSPQEGLPIPQVQSHPITGAPIQTQVPGPKIPMGPDGPVIPDPDVDDDAMHIATIKSFLVDTIGIEIKKSNPDAYSNIIAHLKLHEGFLQMKTSQAFLGTQPGQAPDTNAPSIETEA